MPFIDWASESSVHHRSAINCLHNYALGKMHDQCENAAESKQVNLLAGKSSKGQLRFAEEICKEIVAVDDFVSLRYDIGDSGVPLERQLHAVSLQEIELTITSLEQPLDLELSERVASPCKV
jgi:hypothetical protein